MESNKVSLKEKINTFKSTWKNLAADQKVSLSIMLVLLLAIPLAVILSLSPTSLFSRAYLPITPPITPPTTTPTAFVQITPTPVQATYVIQEYFDGDGNLNPSLWGSSGTNGYSAVRENGRLKLSVSQGSDGVGGNDAIAFPYVNSQFTKITGDFDVTVDLLGVSSDFGWQELKFVSDGSISIRRSKSGLTETLEVWTSPDNTPENNGMNVFRSLPQVNTPLKVRMVRSGSELLAYYFDGNTYVNILDMSYSPISGVGNMPALVVENSPSAYPAQSGYFDNYLANVNLLSVITPTLTISPTIFITPTNIVTPTQVPNLNKPICGQSTIPPATGYSPLTVTLFGAGSSGGSTGIVGYHWDFENNGSWDTEISIDPVMHTYLNPGSYNPIYQVYGSNGVWSDVCPYPYTIVVKSQPTPTVAKPPIGNSAPTINTSFLKTGRKGRAYQSIIRADDKNGDTITMKATNLPGGLTMGNCNFTLNSNKTSTINCMVNGVPQKSGIFASKFEAEDKWGAKTVKTIFFTIFP